MTAATTLVLTPGTCKFCGCTDAQACAGGCAWIDESRTICTRCDSAESVALAYTALFEAVARQAWRGLSPAEAQAIVVLGSRRLIEFQRELEALDAQALPPEVQARLRTEAAERADVDATAILQRLLMGPPAAVIVP